MILLKLLILSVFFTLPGRAFVDMEDRRPVAMEGGALTPFWAQEYIGADLMKEDMRLLSGLWRVPVAVYDTGFEEKFINLTSPISVDPARNGSRPSKGHHGTSVAALINGKGMVSASEMVDYVQLKRVSPAGFYSGAIQELRDLAKKPWVISNSMGWSAEFVLELAQEVDQLGIIWVMAAGNDHPEKIAEHERKAPVISVGSFSPRGLQTLTSQESDQLDILAPADEYQASIDGNGENTLFGETSGAAPLVSATIVNIKSLLPQLTRAQVETILKRTAFRSFHSYYLKENKTGLLNSYKAFKVAERMRNLCGEQRSCIESALLKDETYVFEMGPLGKQFEWVCRTRRILTQEQMKYLRRRQLLSDHPDDSRLLGCAYRNEGFTINADFYLNLWMIQRDPQGMQRKIQKLAVEAVRHGYSQSAAFRDPAILNDEYRAALLRATIKEGPLDTYRAQELLRAYESVERVKVMPSRAGAD